jgi:hypothetical protein
MHQRLASRVDLSAHMSGDRRSQWPSSTICVAAAARAAFQLPQTEVTTLAEGQPPVLSRSSASPPRRRACVRDQSYDDGSWRYRVCQAHIAFITRARVQRRSVAPGWHALQYA